jgi:hypothetical protein
MDTILCVAVANPVPPETRNR